MSVYEMHYKFTAAVKSAFYFICHCIMDCCIGWGCESVCLVFLCSLLILLSAWVFWRQIGKSAR